MTPVFRLWRRRNNSQALIRSTLSQDPSKLKIVVPGFRVWPSDVDYNMHKSNSTYASDMDVARSNVSNELRFRHITFKGGFTDRYLIVDDVA